MKSKVAAAGITLGPIGSTVLGGALLTGFTPASAQTPTANSTVEAPVQPGAPEANESATEVPEANEPATEQAEPNEPALPGGGHEDPAGVDTVHEFEGIE